MLVVKLMHGANDVDSLLYYWPIFSRYVEKRKAEFSSGPVGHWPNVGPTSMLIFFYFTGISRITVSHDLSRMHRSQRFQSIGTFSFRVPQGRSWEDFPVLLYSSLNLH